VAAGHSATVENFARIIWRFLRNRTNSTRSYESTKHPEMRFRARLAEGASEVELGLV
jgi:hypothetical protein